jgi:hypothetical protein
MSDAGDKGNEGNEGDVSKGVGSLSGACNWVDTAEGMAEGINSLYLQINYKSIYCFDLFGKPS